MRELGSGDGPEKLHILALIDLLTVSDSGNSLDRAISSLQTGARVSERPAPLLADLAGAYLMRAERAHAPRDLLLAIESAEAALDLDPVNRVARFNRALALDRFGLAAEAAREWQGFLGVDSMSPVAERVRERLQTASRIAEGRAAAAPDLDAAPAVFAAYATAFPQQARLLGWDHLLGAWANAVLSGQPDRAESTLARAAALGEALERSGGDATLADAVRALQSAGGRRQELARAHRAYAEGRRLYEAAQFQASIPFFRVAGNGGGSPPLRAWARVFLGTAYAHLGDRRGEEMIRGAVALADTVRHSALSARARWSLASTLVRSDRYEAALEPSEASARFFDRAGEREHQGVALQVLANAQFFLGEPDSAYATAYRALDLLRPYRGSVRLHNVLFSIADAAAADGLERAAIRVQNEGVSVAVRNGNPVFEAEAHLARARHLAARGKLEAAARDVQSARASVARITDEVPRRWLEADLHETEALASQPQARARFSSALDSAAALYKARRSPLRAFRVVVSAAEARLAAGDLEGGTERLEAGMRMLAQRRDSIRMEPRRAAVFESARNVVDRAVMLKLAAGQNRAALAYMDGARASLAPAGRGLSSRRPVIRAAAGEVGVEYAIVRDTLLAWTVVGREVALFRAPIDTVRLVRTISQLTALLERPAGGSDAAIALERLYDWLVRPLEPRLGVRETPLVIVADGALASVPFAALRDRRRKRYLVEDHPLRFAVSLREDSLATHGSGLSRNVVLIADPAFDPATYRDLPRLGGAAREAREIERSYPGARTVLGPSATRRAVTQALRRAAVVHYAGHAVFDDERPERSHLVLAPEPGMPGIGALTAGELARLRLDGRPLVVLSACRTVSSGRGRAGGFSGLSGALLAAGAGGVVGGLWAVDDGLTRPLMVEFHRAYARNRNGPAALRSAQLRLLRSEYPALRSPAAWAGFRYAGR